MLLIALLALAPQGGGQPSNGKQEPSPVVEVKDASSDAAWFDPELARRCQAAAEKGLVWLAAHQADTGAWSGVVGHKMQDDYILLDKAMSRTEQERTGHGHLGVSALCGMAFLAGGNLPDRGRYGPVVQRTYAYIAGAGLESGLLTDAGTRMYSHAFATLFLAEIAGMVGAGRAQNDL
ncbi:MAG: hypothetical protein H6838_18300, partial [Planctomycetes bacterium]|nr:hypothetical protein [Planctomycetota bacterium]